MKKTIIAITIASVATITMTGCGGGAPKPSAGNKKPTIFVQSHTAERFKGVTKETALWNGISPFFVKDNQYMRCDMTNEAMVVLVNKGFDIVSSKDKADYTFDSTLLSCGPGYKSYLENSNKLPLKERAIYKDFMKWVNETPNAELPADAKEIANLISKNDPKGFKKFFDEDYVRKYGRAFGDTERWDRLMKETYKYMKKTHGVVLPNKYYGISDEDKAILLSLDKKLSKDKGMNLDATGAGLHLIGSGAMLSGSSPKGQTAGGIAMGIGAVAAIFGVQNPTPVMAFKVTNNKTGKSWKKETDFSIRSLSWKDNIDKPMDDWTIDEIPWGDLD